MTSQTIHHRKHEADYAAITNAGTGLQRTVKKTIDLFILAITESTPNFFFSRPNVAVYLF